MGKTMQQIRKFLSVLPLKNVSSPLLVQVRGSQWAPKFVPPIVDRVQLQMPLDDEDERRYKPIKAARTEETTNLNYDPVVVKFVNQVMKEGNKKLARNQMDRTFENIKRIQIEKYHKASEENKDKIELNPVDIFHQAVENCKPILILKRTVKGGVAYQVPVPCRSNYQRFKAMKWIIETCRDKEKKIAFHEKLAWELLEAANNEGKSVRKKQELHKQCEANKAYAHFRW